jgi:hypothetical protein
LQQLRSVAEPWDADVVRPLRALRVNWKVVAADDGELNALREQARHSNWKPSDICWYDWNDRR